MGGSSDVGAQARELQQQQQTKIDLGLANINKIFGGGQQGTGLIDKTAGYDPNGKYFDANGLAVDPKNYASLLANSGLFAKSENKAGFDKAFYDKRQQDYVKFAMPALTQQFQKTQKGMVSQVAGQGLLNSSAGRSMQQSLMQELARQKQGVSDEGRNQAQSLEQNVNASKSNLISQLQSSADPASTSQQALATAGSFSAPSMYAPLGNLFSNWTSMYGANSMANAYSQYMNPSLNPFRTPGMSGASKGLGASANYVG